MAEAAARAAARGVRSMVGFTYRRVPAIGARPQARRRRAARRHPARARPVPAGLDRRPGRAHVVAAGEGQGRLGRARRHRRAHRRPDAVHHRPDADRGERAARDLRQGAAAARPRPARSAGSAATGRARSPSTTPRSSSAASPAARWPPSRRPGSRWAARTRIRIEINGSAGSLAFDFEDMNVLQFFDGTEPAEIAGFRRILVTEPEHPYVGAWWPAGHGLGYEHGFTHQVVDLVTAIAAGRATRRRRSPTACRCSGCSTPSSAAPPHGRPGPPIPESEHRRSYRQETADAPPRHPVHRPVGRPAVRGDVPARLRVGLRRPGDRLLGRPPRRRARRERRLLRAGAAGRCSTGTACRSSRSPTTSTARPSATTRSTSGTRASSTRACGATATPRASGSGRPRR